MNSDPPAGHVMVGCLGDEAQSGRQTFVDLPRGGEKDVTVKVVVSAGHGASGHDVEFASPALVITGVQPDSPAAQAGLQAGDALVAVDGVPVLELGPQAVFALLDNRPPGAVMTVGVERAGTPINAVLTLPP